jgi:hypothetical protein
MKGTIHQEETPNLNIYAPNTGAPIYIKKRKTLMALRAQIDTNTVKVGDLNIPLSPIVIQTKDQQRNFRATLHIRPNRHV